MNGSDTSRPAFVTLDRRRFLTAAAALVAVGALPSRALALAGPYSFRQGTLDIIVVSDGHLVFPTSILAPDAPPDALKKLLEAAGVTGTEVKPDTNVTLVKAGDETILFDTGSGPNFQPTAGKLVANLDMAGIKPDSITKVVFTHAHPDHIWGTLGAGDNLTFPKAAYYTAAAEWNFWMDRDLIKKVPEAMQPFVTGAQKSLTAVKDKVTMFKPGDEVHAGIKVLDTPGHTPGHVSFEVPGKETLIIVGDAVVAVPIAFPHPEWRFGFDTIPDLAIQTRKTFLDRAATDKIKMLGFHWPYPGIGYAEKQGTGYAYVAAS